MRDHRHIVMAAVLALAAGFAIGRFGPGDGEGAVSVVTEERPLYWVAPMDPDYRRSEPGLSPMGMELVPVYASEHAAQDGDGVSIAPEVQANLGIRTEVAGYGPLQQVIGTFGTLRYDEDLIQHVHTRVEGWIEDLAVRAEGEPVSTGQILFRLYAPTLVNAQEEFLAAIASGDQALIGASRERLIALGMDAEQLATVERARRVSERIAVRAARGGVVMELGIREGHFVTPATEAMAIASLDEVWVVGEVLERQAPMVVAGQEVEVRLDAHPGEVWTGTVDYVHPELQAATRTLPVRVRIANPDETLRPNMFARLSIHGMPTDAAVHLPLEAVIRGGRGDRVVLATDDGRFRSTRVVVGAEFGDRVQILDGVAPGQRVVVSGQFLIDSESSLAGEARRAGSEEQAADEDAEPRTAEGSGTVLGWTEDGERLRIRHGPIESLGWGAMRMPFRLADRDLADGVADGDAVHFTLTEVGEGFVITSLELVEPEDGHADVDGGGR